jgi:hypothetical protein
VNSVFGCKGRELVKGGDTDVQLKQERARFNSS